jgi:hypothetical protein
MSISHDQASSGLLWAKHNWVEIEPEANEIAFTEGDPATRGYMTKINLQITNMIKERFPEIQTNLTPKYNKAFQAFEGQIPQLRSLVRANMDRTENLAGAGILSLALVGAGSFLLLKKNSSRQRRK